MNLSGLNALDDKVNQLLELVEKLEKEKNSAIELSRKMEEKFQQQEKELVSLNSKIEKYQNSNPEVEISQTKEEEILSSIRAAVKKIEKLQMDLL